MSLKPLSNCVLIRQDTEKLSDLIVLPQNKLFSGIIVAIGEGKKSSKGHIEPMNVKEGDHVLFGEFSGQKVTVDNEELLMMREPDIIGILDGLRSD
jgi:chaperonin GroES